MAQQVALKIYEYKQWPGTFDLLPDLQATNSSYAASQYNEVPYDQFVAKATPEQRAALERTAKQSGYGNSLQEAVTTAPFIINRNGNLQLQSSADRAAAMAADPTLRNIGTADAPLYVPKGSAGEANYDQNIAPNVAKGVLNATGTAPGPNAPTTVPSASVSAPPPSGTSSGTGGSTTLNSGSTSPAGDLGPYADLYKQMQDYLDKLQKNGQVINPNVAITPDQLAAFTTQAATQIHPYYATQLAAATDSFLSGLGYNTDQFKNSVQQAQTQYGRNLEALGTNAADIGFAQSGIRQKKEGDLAGDTQNNLDQMRSSLFNTSQNAARSFAQQYGGSGVPSAPTIGAAPRVLSGQSQFDTSGSQQGLYSLDPGIYNRLIGTEQNSEKQATDTLASQLAENANKLTANTQNRSLL